MPHADTFTIPTADEPLTAAILHPDTDHAALQALLEACADYALLIEGRPPAPTAAAETFTDVAPGKTLDDKFLFGLFDGQGTLIGVLDAMRGYPEPDAWFIGLLLIHPDHRGHGQGEAIVRAFEAWAAQADAQRIGLGVLESNTGALRFWSRLGFTEQRRTPPRPYGDREHIVIVMEKPV